MALLRRQVRTQLIRVMGVRREAVVSHVVGAVSVMVRPGWGGCESVEEVAERVVGLMGGLGHEAHVVRSGETRRGVWYVTVTNEGLATEGWMKYGRRRMVQFLAELEREWVGGVGGEEAEVGAVGVAVDLDGELELPDVALEELEASEM